MTTIAQAQNQLTPNTPGYQAQRLDNACRDFESLFVHQMFKSMRKATESFDSGFIKKGQGEEIFTDMMDMELAGSAARANSNGIGGMLFQQMSNSLPKEELAAYEELKKAGKAGNNFPAALSSEQFLALKTPKVLDLK